MKCDKSLDLPAPTDVEWFTEGICPVDVSKAFVKVARAESCGRTVLCRDGLTQLDLIISDIVTGKGRPDDLDILRDLCEVMEETDSCDIVSKTAGLVLHSLKMHKEEWEAHCRRKRCTSLVCESYYSLYIDPSVCTGCGRCLLEAPQGAVAGRDGYIHIIRDNSGLKRTAFLSCCPSGAIKKVGAVKPRLPQEPVPVGSFVSSGGRRRRTAAQSPSSNTP